MELVKESARKISLIPILKFEFVLEGDFVGHSSSRTMAKRPRWLAQDPLIALAAVAMTGVILNSL